MLPTEPADTAVTLPPLRRVCIDAGATAADAEAVDRPAVEPGLVARWAHDAATAMRALVTDRFGLAGIVLLAAPAVLTLIPALLAAAALAGETGSAAIRPAVAELLAGVVGAAIVLALWTVGLAAMHLRLSRIAAADRRDLNRLERTAGRLAADLRQARDHAETLTAMRELSRSLVSTGPDVDAALTDALLRLHDIVDPTAAAIYLDEGTGLRRRAKLGDPPAGWLDHAAEAMQANRAAQIAAADGAHVLILPFAAERDCAGVLAVATAEQRETDAARLTDFLKHVALAVRHLVLFDRATIDGLTRLHNRRQFDTQLRFAVSLASRRQAPLSVIMIDIDHFKKVNDTYGHLSGDAVLSGVAAVMRRTVRDSDLAFRYGGEEMAVLCADTDAAAALVFADRLREEIRAASFTGENGETIRVTASFGISQYESGESVDALLGRADAGLYASKKGGRNRATIGRAKKASRRRKKSAA
jgi:diguanylate cyclase (GGDEF)-like protein